MLPPCVSSRESLLPLLKAKQYCQFLCSPHRAQYALQNRGSGVQLRNTEEKKQW